MLDLIGSLLSAWLSAQAQRYAALAAWYAENQLAWRLFSSSKNRLPPERFTLKPSDGKHACQVKVRTHGDFNYWRGECEIAGYSMVKSYSVPDNFYGNGDPGYDVYQLLPK